MIVTHSHIRGFTTRRVSRGTGSCSAIGRCRRGFHCLSCRRFRCLKWDYVECVRFVIWKSKKPEKPVELFLDHLLPVLHSMHYAGMTLTSIAIRQLTARAWQLPFKNSNDIFFFLSFQFYIAMIRWYRPPTGREWWKRSLRQNCFSRLTFIFGNGYWCDIFRNGWYADVE